MSANDDETLYNELEIRAFNPEGYARFQIYKFVAVFLTAIVVPLGVMSMGSPDHFMLVPLFLTYCVAGAVLAFLMNVEQKKARDVHHFHQKNIAKLIADELRLQQNTQEPSEIETASVLAPTNDSQGTINQSISGHETR
jgi:hypothetical protein